MLWDLQQELKISSADQTATRAELKADRYASDIADLRRHLERVSLACQAMWELTREKLNISDDELDAKMLEIDGRDGKTDGKMATQLLECPSCGKPTNSKRTSCVICGAPFIRSHVFE